MTRRDLTRAVGADPSARSSHARLTLAIAIAASAVAIAAGCAPNSGSAPTTITAAEVPSTPAPEAALASLPASEPAAAAEVPAGQLVCRTKSRVEGTSELFLEWNGDVAKGVLRRVAPSGMVYVQPVRAERASGMIVADDTCETDLVAHAATVRQENGKQLMRLGGEGNQYWSACE